MMYARLVAAFVPLALHGCNPGDGEGGNPILMVPAPGSCDNIFEGTPPSDTQEVPTKETYASALAGLDMDQVAADMDALLVDDKECWPADNGNYGPFMVRLAWHCSGTYRNSDGVGGCAGGRMRFEPERSWPDNTNLDKARALVYPLKQKYGDALSWGDLFVLAGHRALIQSGAPLTKMCYGRIDEEDGERSKVLDEPCLDDSGTNLQGNCPEPHGATTVGLIYVNPEGPNGVPNPGESVNDIRRTFGTMGHSDRATVALIGGGHTIGKAHGACEAGAGKSPKEAFAENVGIWEGGCESGMGEHTTTSGFEGYWTTQPNTWDNEFFVESLAAAGNNWEVHKGPGGKNQWRPAGNPDKNIFRLTSDIALLEDPAYLAIVQEFADNKTLFDIAFDEAWFKLTTNGNGEWSSAAKCDDGSTPPGASARRMRSDDAPALHV